MKIITAISALLISLLLAPVCWASDNAPVVSAGSFIFSAADGRRLRITPYGSNIVRLQTVRAGEDFFADDHYEMVEHHDWPRQLQLADAKQQWQLRDATSQLTLSINKNTLAVAVSQQHKTLLRETSPVTWQDHTISTHFAFDKQEHFTGLGHGYFGREASLDLRGKQVERNYGHEQIEQAPLLVPFYLSSKGYGVFLNSTFGNRFSFGAAGDYSIAIDDSGFGGRMDYFVILGPQLRQVLDNYTQLTGRPRLPMLSMFGLQLSDKSHDHTSPTPSNEQWWKTKVAEHRAAGYPIDHLVNDNRWRAAGGKRCESKLEWDPERYPNPKEYAQWLKAQGLVITLDFNRCIAQYSDGWKPAFNIPDPRNIEFGSSAPDFTNPELRHWFWDIYYRKTLDPKLQFPGDALWIDEFDEMGAAPKDMILADGRRSAEMRNYWFFLIAKALVQDGWDKSDIQKRPYVWVRGMTAGAQRYATLWSGDIQPSYADMASQIRAMQLAGMSGFPFWGHDAGGFYNWQTGQGPDERLYMQWAMAFGSFAPIWKPHGMGPSRWPLDRSPESQQVAHKFTRLRYELMPYLYSAAHQAQASGLPMARPMLLDYGQNPKAWQFDLQYLWGDSLLVAPNASEGDSKQLWLPKGLWYDYSSKRPVPGDQVLTVSAPAGELPLYAKAGAIIPKREFALSTAFIDAQKLQLDIYAGADGETQLVEDDGITEKFRTAKQAMRTRVQFDNAKGVLSIAKAEGEYAGAPVVRQLHISLYGTKHWQCARLAGTLVPLQRESLGGLGLDISAQPVAEALSVQFVPAVKGQCTR